MSEIDGGVNCQDSFLNAALLKNSNSSLQAMIKVSQNKKESRQEKYIEKLELKTPREQKKQNLLHDSIDLKRIHIEINNEDHTHTSMEKAVQHVLIERARDVSRVMEDMSVLDKDLTEVLEH
jgi:hypothetical protein